MGEIDLPPRASAGPGAPPPRDPGLRRRAWLIVAVSVAADVLFAVGWWQGWFSTGAGAALPALGLLAGGVFLLVASAPFRRHELRESLGTPPPSIGRSLLIILAILVPSVPALHYLNGEPWRVSVARPIGILAYLLVFMALARVQRRGIPPYLRPAWHGFLLAGVTGGVVFAPIAGVSDPAEPIISGFSWSVVHLLLASFTMRSATSAAVPQPARG